MNQKTGRISAATFLYLLILLCGVSSYNEFEISVPTGVQMGVYGETVLLPCTFPVGAKWDAANSVITWQRHLEVVHSFFYSQDQPKYQSPRYAKRTSLFHQELEKGNASLRLESINLEDAGEYTCSISTQLGSQRKTFSLKVAAFYPEPRLHIYMLNDGHVEVQVTSEGGYPSPTLQWLMGNAGDVTNTTHTLLSQDQHTHLYSVNSKLNLTGSGNNSILFIMKNPDLGQEIRRNIALSSENAGLEKNNPSAVTIGIIGFILILVIVCILVFSIFRYRRKTKEMSQKNVDLNSVSTSATNCRTGTDGAEWSTQILLNEDPICDKL